MIRREMGELSPGMPTKAANGLCKLFGLWKDYNFFLPREGTMERELTGIFGGVPFGAIFDL